RIAETAFKEGAKAFHAGLSELEVAALFRTPLSTQSFAGVERADGFTYCMSGPNSVCAYASYQRSTSRKVETGDLMLVHCNSYADGYWTDITRTFCIGEADERKLKMYDAVLAARTAALASIRAGVKAAAVDEAAREVMIDCGFGQEFRHGLGHCVGYAAINHNAPPRLHPRSDDVLATGMVFNVEPACYIDGFGGLRHCDMVLVTATGAEVLTPFQNNTRDLTLH
ncbi:MAG TPA: M24 family metallopeptidase, partial [Pyrinomonadaceae bacterium]|nr:M24 family metallopeptidase [Pyrinomonadaceae bacterium]